MLTISPHFGPMLTSTGEIFATCGRGTERFRAKRRLAERHGRDAEDEVAQSWQAKGYRVLAQRLRTGYGELDLVLADRETLVFVEVKARKTVTEAAYAISPKQQARLLDAASVALAQHAEWSRPATRFDVMLVCDGAIEHIEDAIRYH